MFPRAHVTTYLALVLPPRGGTGHEACVCIKPSALHTPVL